MRIGGIDVNFGPDGNVVWVLENRDIYDGWSAAQLTDGTIVNRWASGEDPAVALPGYGRRFEATQAWIQQFAEQVAA